MSMTKQDEYDFQRSIDIASGNDPYAAVMDGSHFRIPFTKWLEGMMPGLKSHVRFAKYREYIRYKLEGVKPDFLTPPSSLAYQAGAKYYPTLAWPRRECEWMGLAGPFYTGTPPRGWDKDEVVPHYSNQREEFCEFIMNRHIGSLRKNGVPITDAVKNETVRFMIWRQDQDTINRSAKASLAAKSRHSRKKSRRAKKSLE